MMMTKQQQYNTGSYIHKQEAMFQPVDRQRVLRTAEIVYAV